MAKKLLLSLSVFVVLFAAFEIRQRLSNRSKFAKRSEKAYSVRGETLDGRPISDKGGAIALRHHPYLVYRARPDQQTPQATINADGFRGRPWVKEKPPGTKRVVVLGGSSVFGQGASSDEAVFTAVLERRLRAQDGKVEVLNAGVIGYSSTQELILLATYVLDYAPDVVVLVDGWNDFYIGATLTESQPEILHPTFIDIDRTLGRSAEYGRGLLRASAVARKLEDRWRKAEKKPGAFGTFSDNIDRTLPRYRTNLSRMCRLATSHGAAVVVVAQPELYLRKAPPDGKAIPDAETALRERFKETGYEKVARAQYASFAAAAGDVARSEGAPFLDATKIFDDISDEVFVDFVHLNDRGNEILADRLATVVRAALDRG